MPIRGVLRKGVWHDEWKDKPQRKPMENFGRYAAIALLACSALVGVTVVGGSWYTIDKTQGGVLSRNGALIGTVTPGLGFKVPLIDSVEKISLENKLKRWDKLEGYSHDQQPAHYMISVNYQIPKDKLAEVAVVYGGESGVLSRIVEPNVLKHSKIVIGQYTAQTSIQDRGKLNTEILVKLQAATAGLPVVITNANVEDITFGGDYLASINKRMVAEVEVQTYSQTLARERVQAQIKVTQAQAIADSLVANATAQAKATTLAGAAEATAIQAKGDALNKNPGLVAYTQAERWNGVLPTMMPGNVVPMLNMGGK